MPTQNFAANVTLGFEALDRGDVATAALCADRVLNSHADFAEAWFLRGLAAHMHGQIATAIDAYEQAIRIKPDYLQPLNNLGVAYASVARHADALAIRESLVRQIPHDPTANCNYGLSLAIFGRHAEAIEHYRRAIADDPNFCDAIRNYGTLLVNLKRPLEAIPLLRRAVELQPHAAESHNNLGLAYLNAGDTAAAIRHLGEALRLDPRNFEALNNLGALHAQNHDDAAALQCFEAALGIRPDAVVAMDNCGNSLQELGRFDEAIARYQAAIALEPQNASPHRNFGKALAGLCRFDDAEARLLEALRLDPLEAETYSLLGLIHFHRGQGALALERFDEALRLNPTLKRARLNRAMALLRNADFARGWPDYRVRLEIAPLQELHATTPFWDGSALAGRTILVVHEQGFGDVLQFLRFLPLVKARGGQVHCVVPQRLMPIAARCRGIDRLYGSNERLPKCDVQIPMMSLPDVLGTIDAPEPHLFADPELVRHWAGKIASIEGYRIGIAWQGDPSFPVDRIRSTPLANFAPLTALPGVRLISLQKHHGVEQLAPLRDRVPVIDFDAELDETAGAFMDTAALMMNLDLIVTSDSAVAHLAGGLGVPTFVALHHAAEWRWFQGREDSPWYPSMRLFRQKTMGDWGDVFRRLTEAVAQAVDSQLAGALEIATHDQVDEPADDLAGACWVAISPGELFDKISILQIKSERMTNAAQIENVKTEIRLLEGQRAELLAHHEPLVELAEQLKSVNEILWQLEDDLRACERDHDFGARFIELARSVYKQNDARAQLKRTINTALGSPLVEEKSYGSADRSVS